MFAAMISSHKVIRRSLLALCVASRFDHCVKLLLIISQSEFISLFDQPRYGPS